MQKEVVIVHKWGGHPKSDWLPWLKNELEKRGTKATIPIMPNTEEPKIEEWKSHLRKTVRKPDENTYFVGHSIGCQAILRFLEMLPKDTKIGGAVFVGGWFKLKNLEASDEIQTAKPWIEEKIDFKDIRAKMRKSVAIFSEDDPYVDLENADVFRKKLGSKIVIEKGRGHFTEEEGVFELDSALNCLLEMMD